MAKNKLFTTALTVALTASCVFAAQNNVSATPSGAIQDGPAINSTGKIESGDGSVSIDSKDIQNLSDAITNNAEIMRQMNEDLDEVNSIAVNVISGFTCSGNSYSLSNDYLKNAKSVQVNYHNSNYDITPSYTLDPDAGELTITGLTNGIIVDNVIVYH